VHPKRVNKSSRTILSKCSCNLLRINIIAQGVNTLLHLFEYIDQKERLLQSLEVIKTYLINKLFLLIVHANFSQLEQ
jgi:hypothetical protein